MAPNINSDKAKIPNRQFLFSPDHQLLNLLSGFLLFGLFGPGSSKASPSSCSMVGLSAGLDFLRQLFGVLISFSTSVYCSNTTIYFSSSDNVWSIRSRHLSLPSSCIVSASPGLDGAQVVATRIRLNSTAGFWVVCFSRALRVSFNWLSEKSFTTSASLHVASRSFS